MNKTPEQYIREKAIESSQGFCSCKKTKDVMEERKEIGALVCSKCEGIFVGGDYGYPHIRLADVLLALGEFADKDTTYSVLTSGKIQKQDDYDEGDLGTVVASWNLHKNTLSIQEDETKLFIAELLGYDD